MIGRKGVETRTLVIILALIFAVIILWFFSGFVIKFTSLVGEAAKTIICGLINWFIDQVGMGLIPHVC